MYFHYYKSFGANVARGRRKGSIGHYGSLTRVVWEGTRKEDSASSCAVKDLISHSRARLRWDVQLDAR